MSVRPRKISSALNAFESTIQKNAESGEQCGMYISNKVGRSGGGLSRSNHNARSRREASRSPTRGRREGGGPSRRAASRSPSRAREGPSRVRGGGGNRSASRDRGDGGIRPNTRTPARSRDSGGGGGGGNRHKTPSRIRDGGGNCPKTPSRNRDGGRGSRSASRRRDGGGGGNRSKTPSRHRGTSRSPSRHRGEASSNEARRAADRFKKRSEQNKGRPRRKERPSNPLDDSGNFELQIDSPDKRGRGSDRSNLTDTTGEMTLEDIDRPDASRGWNSFEESANFFSEAEDSTANGEFEDDFSVISESTFEQPDWNPNLKKKKKKQDPQASWASGFAVSYQQRNDDSDSESDEGERAPRSPRKDQRSRHHPQKSGSPRNAKQGDSFAVTYQHRADESDSDFDAEDMREKIRRRQQKGSGSIPTLERAASFKLTRSTSSRSLSNENGNEDMNNLSFSSLHSRSSRGPGRKKAGGDGLGNMVVGGNSSFHESFLGDVNDDEMEPSFESEHNMFPKTKMHATTTSADEWNDGGAFSSASKPKPKPRPARPTRKYGAAAAAENMSNLPPAFQTIARKQMNEGKTGQSRRPNGSSSRPSDRKARPPKEIPSRQSEEAAIDNAFAADRSFFDCV